MNSRVERKNKHNSPNMCDLTALHEVNPHSPYMLIPVLLIPAS